MSKIKNNEITHTGNSGTSNIVLGSNGEVTPSKLKIGSDAQGDVMYYNGTQYIRLAKGSAGQALIMNSGATAPEWGTGGSKWTQGDSTSVGTGTTCLITGIPATAVMIVLTYNHVSCASSNEDNFILRAGPSSGIVTSSGACRGLSAYMQDNDNGEVNTGDDNIPLGPYAFTAHDGYYHGHLILTKWDTGKYHAQGACFQSLSSITGAPTAYGITLTGEIYLSGALERLQMQFHNGTGTFDDGDYAIGYLEA